MAYAIVLVTSLSLSLWIISKVVSVFHSPLSAVPNAHFTVPFSRLWILWVRATGQEFSTCLAAHRRLGPVIRLSPKEVSINCIADGVRVVYGGNWEKSNMYDMFTYLGYAQRSHFTASKLTSKASTFICDPSREVAYGT